MAHFIDQIEAEYMQAMGEELGLLYSRLSAECAHLHVNWNEYMVLFGANEETIGLLNKSIPSFSRMMQDTLFENVLAHLCRLLDPPSTFGKDNLTVQRLPNLAAAVLKPTLEEAIERVQAKAEFARDWRNKLISHSDLHLKLGRATKPLEPASRLQVKEALRGLTDVLNIVEWHYARATTSYEFVVPLGGAVALLRILEKARQAKKTRRERLLNNCPLPEDLR